ncbi:MAG: hypothetical protein RI967_583, partial [Planctomycetota bacterium]
APARDRAARGVVEDRLLALAAAVEVPSEHPVARAIVAEAEARGLEVPEVSEFAAFAGLGVEARLDSGARDPDATGGDASAAVSGAGVVRAGRVSWLRTAGVRVEPCEGDDAEQGMAVDAVATGHGASGGVASGATVVAVSLDARLLGRIHLADEPRPEARAAIGALDALGVGCSIASGDARAAVAAIASEVGIAEQSIHAGLLPAEKAALLATHSARGRRIAFVGDGINDAPVLAAARPGIAMAAGTDLARASAEVLLVTGDLARIPQAISHARRTMRVVRQNLAWAFGYNLVLVPLAAGAFWPWTGWMLPPMAASAAMALSSVTVVLNSLRLGRGGDAATACTPRRA